MKIIAFLAAFAVAFGAQAETCITNGIEWTYTVADGEATITDVPESVTGDVEIPSSIEGYPVTCIGNGAFKNCKALTGLEVPKSVTSIGSGVLSGCSGLKELIIPFVGSKRGNSGSSNSVFGYIFGASSYAGGRYTDQYYSYYYLPTNLTTVTITDETRLDGRAFRNCDFIKNIKLPETLTSVDSYTFSGCTGIKDVTLPQMICSSTLSSVFPSAYQSITNVVLLDDVTNIGPQLFYDCSSLKNIYVPDTVSSIGNYAFYNCNSLESIDFPGGLRSIGSYAFYNCSSLESVDLPSGLRNIGSDAFYGCSGLDRVDVSTIKGWLNIKFGNSVANPLSKGADLYVGEELVGGTLFIPENITNINSYAFYGFEGVTNVIVSSGVTDVGSYAFHDCEMLMNVTLPDSVTNIATYAFNNCGNLQSIFIPGSVGTVRDYAFNGCTNLTSLIIEEGVRSIGQYAFKNCNKLTELEIPKSVTSIGNGALSGCLGLEELTIPFVGSKRGNSRSSDSVFGYIFGTSSYNGGRSVQQQYSYYNNYSATYYIPSNLTTVTVADETVLGYGAFYNCDFIKYIKLPENVLSIDSCAFYGCSGLSEIEIPSNVGLIGDSAFKNCKGFTSLEIPNSVTNIGSAVLSGCSGLQDLSIPFVGSRRGNSGASSAVFGYIFGSDYYEGGHSVDQRYTTYYIPSVLKTVKLTDETVVGGYAFYNCDFIETVELPQTLIEVDSYAFCGCDLLGNIILPGNIKRIASYAFNECETLQSIVIPECVESVGKYAFSGCDNLSAMKIENGVTDLGAYAFNDCKRLTVLEIPNSVTNIGDGALSGCSNLQELTIPFVGARRGNTGSSAAAFGYVFGTSPYTGASATEQRWSGSYDVTFYIPTNLTSVIVCDETMLGYGAFQNCKNIKAIIIPHGVTNISHYAFNGCGSLKNIEIPDGVEVLGDSAFQRCVTLESAIIPGSIKSFGSYVFDSCTNLSQVAIAVGVESFGDYMFQGCTSLKRMDLPATLSRIGSYAFNECSNLTTLTGGGSVQVFGDYALAECCKLERYNFGDKIKSIGSHAFYNCWNMSQDLIVPNTTYTIDGYAFSNCSNLTALVLGDADIGDYAFAGCDAVEELLFSNISSNEFTIGSMAFSGLRRIADLRIPNLVTSIGKSAFDRCFAVTNISLPFVGAGRATSYKNSSGNSDNQKPLFGYVFTEGPVNGGRVITQRYTYTIPLHLQSVEITDAEGIGSGALRGLREVQSCKLNAGLTFISPNAFEDCSSLSSIEIPDTVTSLSTAFGGVSSIRSVVLKAGYGSISNKFSSAVSITNIVLHENSTQIKDGEFAGCESLTSIRIPAGVNLIGDTAFKDCKSLKKVFFDGDAPNIGGNGIFEGTPEDLIIYVNRDSVGWNGNWTSSELPAEGTWPVSIKGARKIVYVDSSGVNIGDVVTEDLPGGGNMEVSIGDNAATLEFVSTDVEGDLYLPSHVAGRPLESIASAAFSFCDRLTSVVIPNTVTNIGAYAFLGCIFLERVYVPSSVKVVGEGAFSDCWSLVEVVFYGLPPVGLADSDVALCAGSISYPAEYKRQWAKFLASVNYQGLTFELPENPGFGTFGPQVEGLDFDSSVIYDGAVHTINTNALASVTSVGGVPDISYALSENGPWQSDPFVYSDIGTTSIWYRISAENYDDYIDIATVTIKPREGVVVSIAGNVATNVFDDTQMTVAGYKIAVTDSLYTEADFAFTGSAFASGTVPGVYAMGLDAAQFVNINGNFTDVTFNVTDGELVVLPSSEIHKISFDPNGGKLDIDSKDVNLGVKIGDLPVPVRDGYTFLGWYTAASGGEKITSSTLVKGDVKYYAHWTPGSSTCFKTSAQLADEGDIVAFKVFGGNVTRHSSVQVLLAYNTAAAADLDLANGVVRRDGGNVPYQTNLKFPLTITWAPGEIGEKTITIPVKTDKAVEADEFFTLQLANPKNMSLGDADVCTVTIHDPGYDELKAKIDGGTATAKEITQWNKLHPGKAYVRPLASPATGGKVTGGALVVPGKAARLKATALAEFVFAGWYTSAACAVGQELTGYGDSRNPSLAYTATNINVDVFARFIPVEEDYLSLGDDFLPSEITTNAQVSIYVPVESASLPDIKVSGLPSGLKFYAKETLVRATKTTPAYTIPANTIYGTAPKKPTAKPATVTVTVKNAGKYAITRKYSLSIVDGETRDESAEVVSDAPQFYSLAVDLSDDFAGKVTGTGVYQAGRKVTAKATANKGFVFNGWYDGDLLVTQAASYAFTMPDEDVAFVAKFVTAAEDAGSISLTVDALGGQLSDEGVVSVTNLCGVALKWPVAVDALSQPVVAVSGLPSGLKFTTKDIVDRVTKEVTVPANTVYGAPTAESRLDARTGLRKPSVVKFTVTTAGKSKRIYPVEMTILPLPDWAVGTFNGGGDLGQVSLTVAKTGKLSGKYLSEGLTWTLAADSFNSIDESGDVYRATLIGKSGKLVMTNEVGVACDAMGGFAESIDYIAYQNNWKLEPWKTIGKPFAKAAALEYEDSASVAGVEAPGVLSLKFAASGAVTVKGSFVTGVNERTGKDILYTASGSAVLAPQSEPDETGVFNAVVFVYLPPKAGKFDGYVRCIDVRWTGESWIKQ